MVIDTAALIEELGMIPRAQRILSSGKSRNFE
jgi:hypothetical protein